MKREEQADHIAVWSHIERRLAPYVFAFHVPNGGVRSPVEAAIMTRMGVIPGIPDFIFLGRDLDHALELKPLSRLDKNMTSHEVRQAECRDKMEQTAGCATAVAYGADEAVAILERWGLLRGRASISEAVRKAANAKADAADRWSRGYIQRLRQNRSVRR
jgi:hypothetical protein